MNNFRKLKRRNQPIHSVEEISHSQSSNLVSLIGHSINHVGIWRDLAGRGVQSMAVVATFCFIFCIMLQLIGLFKARHDSDKLFESFSVLTFCGMGALKLNSLRNSSERWRFLLSQVQVLENKQRSIVNEVVDYETDGEDNENRYTGDIQSYTNKFKIISTRLPRMYYATLLIFIFSPFIEYGIWKFQGSDTEYPHMLPMWSPLDDLNVFGYILTISIETVACVYCVIVHIAFDVTSLGLMIFICGQFSMLCDDSERIGGSGKKYLLSIDRDARAHYRIIKCHNTHIILVNAISELEKLIKDILGVYFFVATLTLCSVAVRFSSEELSKMQLLSLLQYTFSTLTQLFMFCYYGDALLHKSSVGTGEGPFVAASWCLSPRTRRELHILTIGMAKTRVLRAGPFNSLNLPSFIQIVRAAYSYYAVLRQ